MSLKTKVLCFMLVLQVPPFSGFGPVQRNFTSSKGRQYLLFGPKTVQIGQC